MSFKEFVVAVFGGNTTKTEEMSFGAAMNAAYESRPPCEDLSHLTTAQTVYRYIRPRLVGFDPKEVAVGGHGLLKEISFSGRSIKEIVGGQDEVIEALQASIDAKYAQIDKVLLIHGVGCEGCLNVDDFKKISLDRGVGRDCANIIKSIATLEYQLQLARGGRTVLLDNR